ncbi:hypothetical protein RJ641_024814 [Dillenia turbinata]|uniref:F-box domain-containing protein n=1 Tax=Dillenia turbinata TaxID=194707 RepID=A0AAN8ZNB2_9MAGN
MELETFDMISNLPSELLGRIVSFLPLKQAVKTSILSNVWRSFWSPSCIDLDFVLDELSSREATEEVTEVIGKFIRSYDSPELCKFYVDFAKSQKERCSRVKDDALFLSATKGAEKELRLDFHEQQHQLTSGFNLKMEDIASCPNFGNDSSFSSLKTLHLTSMTRLAENLVSSLFSNCRLLEHLRLEKCSGLQSVDLNVDNSLQTLILLDCPNMVYISISSSTLKKFWYRGVLSRIWMNNTANLDDAMLDFKDGPGQNEFDFEEVIPLLQSLKNVHSLALSGWLLEFYKLKEFWWVDSVMNKSKQGSIACLMKISPSLEKLFINLLIFCDIALIWLPMISSKTQIDPTRESIVVPTFHQFWHEPYTWIDCSNVNSNDSKLAHLKVVKLVGSPHDGEQVLLFDLVLEKAINLNLVTVKAAEDDLSWRVVKIPKSQITQTSRSHRKQIQIPSKEYLYGFVDDNSINFSDRMTGLANDVPCSGIQPVFLPLRLHVRSVTPQTSSFMSSLFPNCDVLESLQLEKGNGLLCVNIKANNCLQRLVISDCPNISKLRVSAPNLRSFSYRGVLPQIQLDNTLNLECVKLDFTSITSPYEFDHEEIVHFLASLKDVESMILSGWLLENRRSVRPPYSHDFWQEPQLWIDYYVLNLNASYLENLKVAKLIGFVDHKDQLLIMDHFLMKAVNLESMIVSAENH